MVKESEQAKTKPEKVVEASSNMSRLLGSLEPYVPGESFEEYMELVENYFELNALDDDKFKVMLLINKLGTTASTRVIKAFKPKLYRDETYGNVVKMCKKLFIGERSTLVETFKFNTRNQRKGETISEYAVELQAASENCDFKEFQDRALRDRFVAGLWNNEIKQNLLKLDESKTFTQFVDAALREALVVREAKSMSVNESTDINFVREKRNRGRSKSRNGRESKFSQRRSPSRDVRDKRDMKCYRCQGKGHFAAECNAKRAKKMTNRRDPRGSSNKRQEDDTSGRCDSVTESLGNLIVNDGEYKLKQLTYENLSYVVGNINSREIAIVNVYVEATTLRMELDTGSPVSVCGKALYDKFFNHLEIRLSKAQLSVVSGEILRVYGFVNVRVNCDSGNHILRLFVIESDKIFIPLLGREWIDKIFPAWRQSFRVNSVVSEEKRIFREKALGEIKLKYSKLFDNDMSKPIEGFTVDIKMSESAKPFVHKACTIPFNLRDRVEAQLEDLVRQGVLESVEYASWASPMVIVAKANKEIRICIDGSRTINPHIETNHYPLPVIDELLASKGGAKCFCVLDLKGAYQQLRLSDSAKKLLVVNTIKGLFAYTRLPFGVKPAASIFQSVIDQILKGLENVQAYIDDIIFWGSSVNEVYERVKLVLERLVQFNVKVNFTKCNWFVDRVRYLGHELSTEGISPNPEKLRAIAKAPEPKNVTQLKAFIGMVMFYSKFLPKLSISLAPLYKLLRKGSVWNWDEECQKSFDKCKQEVCSERVLVHYDPSLPIVITTDASDDGIAGVLSHRIDGDERPVFFVSRTLTSAEKKYPILHREALAIVFAMERFYKYVYGHHVEIFTDHKPLEGIFQSKKGEPPVVATRLQRYILRLSIFDYTLTHRKGCDNSNADSLSRLPVDSKLSESDDEEQQLSVLNSVAYESLPLVDPTKIGVETGKDKVLRQVRECVMHGWRDDSLKKELKHYFAMNKELNVGNGCIMYGDRVIIPATLRKQTLDILHANHAGIVRMKQVAREFVFWEGINDDIELFVQSCESCQILRKDKPNKIYGNWPVTSSPFERIHIDFFDFHGYKFLILIDAHTRWLEIRKMNRTNASALIRVLKEIFSVFGFPREIVSDNGPPFSSYEFRKSCEDCGIKLTHSPPYHPQSNGLAERAVQTAKTVLRKFANDKLDSFQLERAIELFLFNHRNLPCTETKIVPAHLMFSFKPRNPISILTEKSQTRVEENRITEKNKVESSYPKRSVRINLKGNETRKESKLKFAVGEEVLYLSKTLGYCKAFKARIVKRISENVYCIKVSGLIKTAQTNQLRKSILKKNLFGSSTSKEEVSRYEDVLEEDSDSSAYESYESAEDELPAKQPSPEQPAIRKSTRTKKKTSFYQAKY